MEISKIQTSGVYKKVVIGFCIATVLMLGLIFYYSFSKTLITITLSPQDTSVTFPITVKKDLAPEDQNSNSVLAGYLVNTTVEETKTFPNPNKTGGQIDSQATGTVTIINNWSQIQPLAATTRLLSEDGILFRLKNRVDVPAGGKAENVEVYADKPGITGNIEPTKFTIPGLWPGLQEKIYAESSSPMTGGVREGCVVNQANINDAIKTLTDSLIKKAITELEQTDQLRNNKDTISEQAVTTTTLSEKSSVEAGQEAAAFDLSLKLKITAVVFSQTRLKTLAKDELTKELADDQQLQGNGPITLLLTVEDANLEKQTASLNITASGSVVPRLSNSIFNRDKITGKDRQEINAYFSNFDEIKSVAIKFSPFWVRKAPSLKDHIEIKLVD